MARFFNYNSFVIFALVVFVMAAVVFLRQGRDLKQWGKLGAVALILLLVYFGLRPAQATSNQAADFQAQIGSGTPVLLEFQSNN